MRILILPVACGIIACELAVISCRSQESLQPPKQFVFDPPGGRKSKISQLSVSQQGRVAAIAPKLRLAKSGMTRAKVMEMLNPVECFPGAEKGGLRYERVYLAADLRVPLIFEAKATTLTRDDDVLWSGIKSVELLSTDHWQMVALPTVP